MMKTRRQLLALAALSSLAPATLAQNAPIPPLIRVVVPFSPGAGTDVLARAVAAQLGARLGTSVIVENRAGAAGMLGAADVAKGQRNGSVLLFHNSSLVTSAAASRKLPFDVLRDLVPVAMVADATLLVGVSAQAGVRTPEQLVAAARAKPGGITAGSPGVGTVTHMATELLASTARIDIRHVPYKGAAPALVDVAAGMIDMLIGTYSSLAPQIKSGRVTPIGVTSAQPNPAYPGLPSMGSIAPGYTVGAWFAMFAPAGTPAELVHRLNQEINAISMSGEVRELVQADGATPVALSPEAVAHRVRQDHAMWTRLAREKQIVLE